MTRDWFQISDASVTAEVVTQHFAPAQEHSIISSTCKADDRCRPSIQTSITPNRRSSRNVPCLKNQSQFFSTTNPVLSFTGISRASFSRSCDSRLPHMQRRHAMQRYQSDVSLLVPRSPWRARQTCPPDLKLFARSVNVRKAKRQVCGRAIRQLTLCGLCVEAETRVMSL